MKKIYIVIICVLLAFIPTYIAIASYFSTQMNPVKHDTVEKIEIISPIGTKSEISRDNDSQNFIEFAVSMNDSAQKILALPEPLVDNPYFSFIYYSYGKPSEYKYYFSNHSPDAYLVDPSGFPYHIDKEHAEVFLRTEYAHSIFDYSTPPSLSLDSNIILPSKSEWQFKGYKDEFTKANANIGKNNSIETYGTPNILFDIDPDVITISLTENGTSLFEGYYSELFNNNFSGHTADAHIVATWYDSSDRAYRGEISYDFTITFKEPPVFFISSDKALVGDMLTLSVLNVENIDNINFKSEPSIGFDPVFYSDGKYTKALIPVSSSLVPGSYKLSVDYNGQSSTEFVVEISTKYTANYPYNVEANVFSSQYNADNIAAYNKLFDSFFEASSESRLFDGKFISGLPSGTFESADFGDLLTISANDVPFENPGVYYSCTKQSEVSAVNFGKVIYAGSDTLAGNIVAIDHGFGLVSIYKHLGSVSLKAGDTVNKGDLVGVSGRTGFISKKSAHITVARVELYVNKIPVDIDPLIANGVSAIQ